jgi:DNA repair exonuclease SbcCD ATPase subunit
MISDNTSIINDRETSDKTSGDNIPKEPIVFLKESQYLERIVTTEVKLQNLNENFRDIKNLYSELQTEQTILAKDITSVKNSINSLKNNIGTKISANENNIETKMSALEKNLRTEISALENNLRTEISALENNLRTEISALEKNMSTKLDSLEKSLGDRIEASTASLRYVMSIIIVLVGGLLGLLATMVFK